MEKMDAPIPIQTVLNGSNYILCVQEMSNFLRGRKLWHYFNSEIREPTRNTDETSKKTY